MKYDVKCEKCGWEGEIEHSINEEHPSCKQITKKLQQKGLSKPRCASPSTLRCKGKLTTQFKTAPPIRFKGEGWTPKFRNQKEQQQYSKGRIEERKQNLRAGGGIHDMDEHRD